VCVLGGGGYVSFLFFSFSLFLDCSISYPWSYVCIVTGEIEELGDERAFRNE
jgi:hypothetical protein